MNINNFTKILELCNTQIKKNLEEMAYDCLNMIQTEQMTIDLGEDLMLKFINTVKHMVLNFFSMTFSNLQMNDDKKEIRRNGIVYKKTAKNREISILTKLGNVVITRDYYSSRSSSHGFAIVDEKLEVNTVHRMTKSMIEELTFVGQKESSFNEGSGTIKRYLGLNVSPKQIQLISEEVGEAIFKQDMEKSEQYYSQKDSKHNCQESTSQLNAAKLMYVLADGSMLSLVGKSNWKEIKLGLVIRDDAIKNQNSDNMEISKREYISYLGDKDNFKKVLYAIAKKNGYLEGFTKVICLADGASWLCGMFEELFPNCEKILDNYHFTENVNKFAEWVFKDNEISKKQWVDTIIDLSFQNKTEEILEKISTLDCDIKKRGIGVPNLYSYIFERKQMIRYGEYREKGYIIGSGQIESAHKAVLQKRLKQSGMHWSKEGAQAIATLRTKYKSDLWHMVTHNINENSCNNVA